MQGSSLLKVDYHCPHSIPESATFYTYTKILLKNNLILKDQEKAIDYEKLKI